MPKFKPGDIVYYRGVSVEILEIVPIPAGYHGDTLVWYSVRWQNKPRTVVVGEKGMLTKEEELARRLVQSVDFDHMVTTKPGRPNGGVHNDI